MSDLRDVIDKTIDDDEILKLQDEEFLAEQDKKFEELRLKLQSLKEENKRQIDVIINSLDQLMAEKTHIDETLKDLNITNDQIERNVPALPPGNPFKVVDYLAKITGYSELEDNVSSKIINQQNESDVVRECKESIMEIVDNASSTEIKENKKENCNDNVKSEIPAKKSEVQKELSAGNKETAEDTKKSSKDSKVDSNVVQESDD